MGSTNENLSNSKIDSSEEESCLLAMHLAGASVFPMVLKAAIELDLLELIKKVGPDSYVSPSQLATQIPTTNPMAHIMIDRILRFLATYSVVNCSLKKLPEGRAERLYSLAPVSKFFTKNDDGVSIAPLVLKTADRIFHEMWYHLKDVVLDGGIPFDRAYGMSVYEYAGTNPRFNQLFNLGMSDTSTIIMKKILEMYDGFEGIETLVDVAGGIGGSINMIISKYPSTKGINFDLPHVIKQAPSYPGVEHVGGDMFVSVPKGDVIFVKWICHNWTDEQCLKLLKNCYESIPEKGKVILVDGILPETPNTGLSSKIVARADMIMLSLLGGGKERTENEFEALAKAVGFKKFTKVCCAYNSNAWVMELWK